MKIVYVVYEFPSDCLGGIGVAVFQVAKDMLSEGYKVWVLSAHQWDYDNFPSIGFFDEKIDGLSVGTLIFNPEQCRASGASFRRRRKWFCHPGSEGV